MTRGGDHSRRHCTKVAGAVRRGSGVRAQGGAGRGVAGARERGQTAVACARSELGPSVGARTRGSGAGQAVVRVAAGAVGSEPGA